MFEESKEALPLSIIDKLCADAIENLKRERTTTMTCETKTTLTNDQLKSFIERIERLEEEKKGIAEDIKEVYAGAKAVGFDTKIMRKVIQVRKMDRAERQEMESLLDVYLAAVEGRNIGGVL